jgi:hypothetical protein
MTSSILRLALVGGAALTVAGCASDGYHGYGYAGASYGYSGPGYGWYEDYYYPGTGFYVYERSGKRHRWSDSQRRHWQSRHGDHDRDHRRHYGDGDHSRNNQHNGNHDLHGRGGDRHGGGNHRGGDRHGGGNHHDGDNNNTHHRH